MRFSPLVGIEASDTPESLLLDIGGVTHLFGGEAALVRQIIHGLAARGQRARAAVADTIGAAWAVAHFAERPDRQVPSGETLRWLRPLPIEALRLPEPTVSLLHQLGIWQIEQFEPLPRRELSSRFGPELLRQWDRATGELDEPLPAHEPQARFVASWSPEHPTARRETITAAIEHLANRLARQLVPAGRGAMQLECRLECASGDSFPLSVGLFQPTAQASQFVELLDVQFERVRLPSLVQSIRLEATTTAPLELRQQTLFSEGSPRRHPRNLAGLLNRLSNRLGRRQVVRVRLVPDAQPEMAYQYIPVLDSDGRQTSSRAVAMTKPSRPSRLLATPVPLTTNPRSRFEWQEHSCQIAQTWGPERIETGWWRGRAVGRDYYRIETDDGRRFWVFRRLNDDRWFLHGIFD